MTAESHSHRIVGVAGRAPVAVDAGVGPKIHSATHSAELSLTALRMDRVADGLDAMALQSVAFQSLPPSWDFPYGRP